MGQFWSFVLSFTQYNKAAIDDVSIQEVVDVLSGLSEGTSTIFIGQHLGHYSGLFEKEKFQEFYDECSR